MSRSLLAGIFLERQCARVIVAERRDERMTAEGPEPIVQAIGQKRFTPKNCRSWDGASILAHVVATLAPFADDLVGIGVGCYGPFVSMRRVVHGPDGQQLNADYGRLDVMRADLPLRGLSLAEEFQQGFAALGKRAPTVLVQTDASVAALGESWYRRFGREDVLVFLFLTEGIGGGYVTGRVIGTGALHPEMGLIAVDVDTRDPLKRRFKSGQAVSLGELARAETMLERAQALGHDVDRLEQLLKLGDAGLWPVWANYIAQMCMTCTAVLSPRAIVLGGPLSLASRCLPKVRGEFERLWSERLRGPAPTHDALESDGYISLSSRDRSIAPELAGAIFLANLAARSPSPETKNVEHIR